jgi:hypothetical protein
MLPFAGAQTLTLDHLAQSQLIEKALELNAKAQGPEAAASSKLNEYPNHFTMIALRHKDGGAEIDENYADSFFVVRGSAKLLTGGTVQNGKNVSPGEIRGESVLSGAETTLNQGRHRPHSCSRDPPASPAGGWKVHLFRHQGQRKIEQEE